jgi:nucleotide sugar dehydrogenase
MEIAVIGLGKLGVPIATFYAHRGARVLGVDVDPAVVDAINRGESPIGPEPGVDEHLTDLVMGGQMSATTEYSDLAGKDVVLVLVPLLAPEGQPDFRQLDDSVASMAPHLSASTLVIFETTLPIGTTRERFEPVLRQAEPSIMVAFSPERVSSGQVWYHLELVPKIVGGVDGESVSAAKDFYAKFLETEVWAIQSAEAAEMVKLAETTYRDLNIAYANELARFCDEWSLDISEIVASANSQPHSHIHRPGVGVGGHCIPHYPHLLESSTSGSALVMTGRHINAAMPEWVIDRIEREYGPVTDKTVLLRGIAYRASVRETERSPAFDLQRILVARGATVVADDPLYDTDAMEGFGFDQWIEEVPDIAILVTDHHEFVEDDWSAFQPMLVVDGRNALDRSRITADGHDYLGVGR